MASMSLDNQIKKYLPQLSSGEKESLLSVIRSFLKLDENSTGHSRISVEQYNNELEKSMREYENGEWISQEDLEKESKSW